MRYAVVFSLCVLTAAAVPGYSPLTRIQDSRDALDILDAVKQAQTDLQHQNQTDARRQIDRALNLESKLDKSGALGRMVPIYEEAVSVAVFTPSKIVGTNQQNSADRLANLPNPTVQDVVGESTRVFVDTKRMEQDLNDAKKALDQGDPTKAESALNAAETARVTEKDAGDEPLARARANLFRAARHADRYLFQDTVASLSAAAKALEDYANANGPHQAGARVIAREIVLYEPRMPHEPTQVAGRIEGWWERVSDWTATPQKTQTTAQNRQR